jgi:hypothetical protein
MFLEPLNRLHGSAVVFVFNHVSAFEHVPCLTDFYATGKKILGGLNKLICNTILRRSGWEKEHFNGKLLLECGCCAGHDTEALLNMSAS